MHRRKKAKAKRIPKLVGYCTAEQHELATEAAKKQMDTLSKFVVKAVVKAAEEATQ